MAYKPLILSASTNGQPLVIDATSSPGTLLHTVSTATAAIEDVFVDVWNTATADALLTMELGATGETRQVSTTVPTRTGPWRMVSGDRFSGATGITIRAFATATGIFRIAGGVNQSL